MKELSEMAQTAFKAMAKDGKLQAMVSKQVESCVAEAIRDCTGYGSDFSKALKDYVKGAMPMNFSHAGLAGYNATIMQIIQTKMDGCLMEWVNKTIAESMDKLLEPAPAEIRLSEFIKELRKHVRVHESDGKKTLKVEFRESSGGFWHVDLKVGDYDKYHLAVTKDGEVYSIHVPYRGDITKCLFAGRSWGLEGMLWRFYACKTKIIRDAVRDSYEFDDEESNDD